MNSEKLIGLVKQFRDIERSQKDLDFRRAAWARDARECFSSDRAFATWCKSDIGLTDAAVQDLCLLARAAGVVPDQRTWIKLGGSREIRTVSQLSTKREQVTVIEAAKATGRSVRSLVRERLPPDVSPLRPPAPRKMSDAEVLARYIADHMPNNLPADVEVIVRMYAPRGFRKAA